MGWLRKLGLISGDSAGKLTDEPGELNLLKTLENGEAKAAFLTFAKSEFSEENLVFWDAVHTLQAEWDRTPDADGREALCKAIIKEYLLEGAKRQVCIGNDRVKAVLASGEYSRDMFDMPQQIALSTLQEDIFPRFCDSDAGKELAHHADLCS